MKLILKSFISITSFPFWFTTNFRFLCFGCEPIIAHFFLFVNPFFQKNIILVYNQFSFPLFWL
nr:MAG TPA: hypothetical protein [Caudoviricetes sp.]